MFLAMYGRECLVTLVQEMHKELVLYVECSLVVGDRLGWFIVFLSVFLCFFRLLLHFMGVCR